MTVSRLDQLYRRLLLTKFFTRGWGKPDNLKRLFAFRKILSNRETCQHLVPANYPIHIDKEYKDGECIILEGHFLSPFIHHLPGIMPKEVETASFQMILPHHWRHSTHSFLKPVCIHLAGTGDHYFWRRRILTARPLLKEAGIASILLENPYYGTRKPKQQLRSSLHNVSDLFVMGGALVLESLALLHWCEREGWGPLGLSGVSMGGHMASGAATLWPKPISLVPILSWTTASIIFTQPNVFRIKTNLLHLFTNYFLPILCRLITSDAMTHTDQMASLAATNWTKPISLIPCLSWSTASCVFTQGVMSGAIPWKTLQEQFFENSIYQDEIKKLIISPEDTRKAYVMGQQFVKDYSHNIQQVESIHQQLKNNPPSPISSFGNLNTTSEPTPKSFTQTCDSGHSSVLPDSSVNCEKNTTGSKEDLKCNGITESLSDVRLNVLTCEEYIARVKKGKSLNEVSESSMVSQSRESAERVLSVSVSENSGSALNSFTSSSVSSQQQQHSWMPASASVQQQPHLSSPSAVTDTQLKHTESLTHERAHSDLSFTRSSHFQQQSSVHSIAEPNSLILKDALSKSRLMTHNLTPSSSSLTNDEHMKDLQQEALDFMRGVMDECTHLGNFSVPVDPELVIIVSARQDAYVPKEGVIGLDHLWPGCEVRYVEQGHVGAVLFNQSFFRKAIIDAFDRQIKKYYQNPGSPDMKHPLVSVS